MKYPKSIRLIYRGPGFLAVISFGSFARTFPPPSVSKLSLFFNLPVWRRSSFLTGRGGGGEEQIIRRQESLVLYKSFNTLCVHLWLWRGLRVWPRCRPPPAACWTSGSSRSGWCSSPTSTHRVCCLQRLIRNYKK
jgi:hypothetical protein